MLALTTRNPNTPVEKLALATRNPQNPGRHRRGGRCCAVIIKHNTAQLRAASCTIPGRYRDFARGIATTPVAMLALTTRNPKTPVEKLALATRNPKTPVATGGPAGVARE